MTQDSRGAPWWAAENLNKIARLEVDVDQAYRRIALLEGALFLTVVTASLVGAFLLNQVSVAMAGASDALKGGNTALTAIHELQVREIARGEQGR